MKTTETEAAAAVRIGAGLGQRKRAELLERSHGPARANDGRIGKYVSAVMSGLPKRNGWGPPLHR